MKRELKKNRDTGWVLSNPVARGMEHRLHSYAFKSAMHAIGASIEKSTKIILDTKHHPHDEFAAMEGEIIEALLGCAFVLCQTYITGVVSTVMSASEWLEIPGGTKKKEIVRHGSDCPGKLKMTYIEAMDAIANYFKHNEQWDWQWEDDLTQRTKLWSIQDVSRGTAATINAAQACGLHPLCAKNMRTAARLFGYSGSNSIQKLVQPLQAWHKVWIKTVRRAKLRRNRTAK